MPELHVVDTPPPAAPSPRRSRWRADALLVLLLAIGCYALSSAVDLSEKIEHWLARSEGWQADELPLTLTVLAGALTWFAVRRRNETLAELRAREQAEARVQGLLAHNRELARQLIAVQESERRALARELHDDLGQACSAIRVDTAYIRHCNEGGHAGIAAAAERVEAEAQRLYGQVRDMLRRLRPVELDSLGLLAALQALCEAWEARSGVACSFHHEGTLPAAGEALDITVYRVAQEALSNVMRHAQASGVRLRLKCSTQELVLSVQDDGRGMDTAAPATRGLGLLGAGERAAALGGRLLIESAPGAGLRLELHLPLAEGATA